MCTTMRVSVGDMTEGKLHGKIVRFALPLIMTNFLQLFFNMADLAVAGQFAGAMALGAVGSTTTSVWLFTGFLIGVANGVNVIVARYLGARDTKGVVRAVHTALLLCLTVGILSMAAGLLGSTPLLKLLGTRPELLTDAARYLKICALGFPALALYNFGNATLSAAGDTKTPLFFLSVSGVVNVILNLIFVIFFRLGVVGVALATTISQYLSAFLILRVLIRTPGLLNLRMSELKLDRGMTRAILGVGIPMGLQSLIFNISNLFLQAGLNTFDAITVAGSTAAGNADNIAYNVFLAFYTAASSFISQNFGAKQPKRILHSYLICQAYSVTIALVLGLIFFFFGEGFLSIFNREPAVIAAGMERLRVMALAFTLSAVMDCVTYAVRGLGKNLVPTVLMILGVGVFRIVWILFIFPHRHTLAMLYALYPVSWGLTAVMEVVYFLAVYKKESKRMLTGKELSR